MDGFLLSLNMKTKFLLLLGASLFLSACTAAEVKTTIQQKLSGTNNNSLTPTSAASLDEATKTQIQTQSEDELLKSLDSEKDLNFSDEFKSLETDLK